MPPPDIKRRVASAQSTRLLLSSDLVAYCGFVGGIGSDCSVVVGLYSSKGWPQTSSAASDVVAVENARTTTSWSSTLSV